MNTTDKQVWVRALTIATIAAAGAFLSGCSLLGQLDNLTGDDTTTGDDSAFQIKVGECYNDDSTGDEVSEVQKVDCAEPHVWEAYASIVMDDGDGSYPGRDAVNGQAETECLAAFTGYVGVDYENSSLYASWLSPTQDSWEKLSDREILCIVTTGEDLATPSTGSVKGSGL